jgi:hypothetical protein
MATRSRRGTVVEATDINALQREIRARTRQAADTIHAVLAPEDRGEAEAAIDSVEAEALSALTAGADADEVLGTVDESFEEFESALDAAIDAAGQVNEEAVQGAVGELSSTVDTLTLSAITAEVPDDDAASEASEASEASSVGDEERSLLESSGYASPAQALGSPAVSEIDEDEEGRWDTDSAASESESSEDDDAFLQRELLARRGALGTASAEDASDIRIKQETALERAKERREAKAATAAAEQRAAKVREAEAAARKALIAERFGALRQTLAPETSSLSNPAVSSIVSSSTAPREALDEPRAAAPLSPPRAVDTGDVVEDPSLELGGASDVQQSLGELDALGLDSSSDEEVFDASDTFRLGDIDGLFGSMIEEARDAVLGAVNVDATSAADLSVAIEKEAGRRVDMETIKDRLTDPAQARAFAAATRNTPRLLRLIAQGVYAPTAFTGTAGKEAAAKIEADLSYVAASTTKAGSRRAADPIAARELPTRANPDIRRWRRPRFTTAPS